MAVGRGGGTAGRDTASPTTGRCFGTGAAGTSEPLGFSTGLVTAK